MWQPGSNGTGNRATEEGAARHEVGSLDIWPAASLWPPLEFRQFLVECHFDRSLGNLPEVVAAQVSRELTFRLAIG